MNCGAPLALSVCLLLPAFAAPLAAQEGLAFERDPRPKLFVTDFTWYYPNRQDDGAVDARSLACTPTVPRLAFGEITATDYLSSDGYYGGKYRRFKDYGVDGIAFVVTDRIPDSIEGANLVQAADLAAAAGLEFFAYYDIFSTAVKESAMVLCLRGGKCALRPGDERVPAYNLAARPRLYEQLRDDFEAIARHLVQPHMSAGGGGYLMLEDASGERVLDEEGLPRPVITLYIARTLSDNRGNLRRIDELMDEVTDVFRSYGIGRPAMVLDVIFWVTPSEEDLESPYDPAIVDAFGDSAVAVTWYGFFDVFRGNRKHISNDGPRPPMEVWAKYLNQQYVRTRDALADNGQPLMLWPAGQTQIDTRDVAVEGCRRRNLNVVYHLRSADDWRAMLSRVVNNAWRPRGDERPLQTVALVTNAGEWFEMGAIDVTRPDRFGECSFPFHWCESLLEVVREEDRYP